MGTSNYNDEIKRDAVHQIVIWGYSVREVSNRLGVNMRSIYKWIKQFAEPDAKSTGVDHEAENRLQKRELAYVTEERDILKMGEVFVRLLVRGQWTSAFYARESQ